LILVGIPWLGSPPAFCLFLPTTWLVVVSVVLLCVGVHHDNTL
jgi:hypothetical protein